MRMLSVVWFLVLSLAPAYADGWVINRVGNAVQYTADGHSWQPARVGIELPNSSWIRTGPRGRVILAKGEERIIYRPNTLAAITTSTPRAQKTRVTQRRGTLLLAVKKRRRQHTTVVTPHLAAVVKGTVFEVRVGDGRSSVRVDEGVVEVQSDGQSSDVTQGLEATAGTKTKLNVVAATVTSLAPGKGRSIYASGFRSIGNGKGNNGNGNAGSNGNGNGGNGNGGNSGSGNGNNGNGNNGNGGGNGKGNNGNGNGNGGSN